MTTRTFMIFLLVLWCAATSHATTFYVSPSGNDSNPGTSLEQAWQTITKVNQTQFLPGDSVLFEGGQFFSGSLLFDNDPGSSPSLMVTVGSYPSTAYPPPANPNRATILPPDGTDGMK